MLTLLTIYVALSVTNGMCSIYQRSSRANMFVSTIASIRIRRQPAFDDIHDILNNSNGSQLN